MVSWAAVFFMVLLTSVVFGFGGSVATTTEAAKTLFYLCLIFAAGSLVVGS